MENNVIATFDEEKDARGLAASITKRWHIATGIRKFTNAPKYHVYLSGHTPMATLIAYAEGYADALHP